MLQERHLAFDHEFLKAISHALDCSPGLNEGWNEVWVEFLFRHGKGYLTGTLRLRTNDRLSKCVLAALRFAARGPAAQGRVVCLPNPALSPSVRKRTTGACWAILVTRLTALV
jgi:hypothetical protein